MEPTGSIEFYTKKTAASRARICALEKELAKLGIQAPESSPAPKSMDALRMGMLTKFGEAADNPQNHFCLYKTPKTATKPKTLDEARSAAHSAVIKVQHLLRPVTPVTGRLVTPTPAAAAKSGRSSIGSVTISPATARTLLKYRAVQESPLSPPSPFAYKTAAQRRFDTSLTPEPATAKP